MYNPGQHWVNIVIKRIIINDIMDLIGYYWIKRWLGREDSNLRMPASKAGALGHLATPHREARNLRNFASRRKRSESEI